MQNLGKIKTKFGKKMRQNMGKSDKIWANFITFGQNKNLASPKAFNLLQL